LIPEGILDDVIEETKYDQILSEHGLEGWLEGYTKNGGSQLIRLCQLSDRNGRYCGLNYMDSKKISRSEENSKILNNITEAVSSLKKTHDVVYYSPNGAEM
jgi:hypothetical protein